MQQAAIKSRCPTLQGSAKLAASSETMLDLVEIELIRVRNMAVQAEDTMLLYLIDMAIMEAKSKAGLARANSDDPAGTGPVPTKTLTPREPG